MKKRIEKVVEWTRSSGKRLTHLKKYNVLGLDLESENYYNIKDDLGFVASWAKQDFKVVSEREVLEFEGDDLSNPYFLHNSPSFIPIKQEIDLTKYNIKVIATPKDNPLESKSKEELIEIIKELKEKE